VSNLHVVYRVHDPGTRDEQWVSCSFPRSIYIEGPTLDEVRSEFRAAVADPSTEVRGRSLIEHLERPLAPGAYIPSRSTGAPSIATKSHRSCTPR
jgi:hypothetical protein